MMLRKRKQRALQEMSEQLLQGAQVTQNMGTQLFSQKCPRILQCCAVFACFNWHRFCKYVLVEVSSYTLNFVVLFPCRYPSHVRQAIILKLLLQFMLMKSLVLYYVTCCIVSWTIFRWTILKPVVPPVPAILAK